MRSANFWAIIFENSSGHPAPAATIDTKVPFRIQIFFLKKLSLLEIRVS
jgi:hypothetical protein